jgi:hypothetical protein
MEVSLPSVHKFKVGEIVNYSPIENPHARRGQYKIVRLMPPEGRDFQYRVQSVSSSDERVVRESELS